MSYTNGTASLDIPQGYLQGSYGTPKVLSGGGYAAPYQAPTISPGSVGVAALGTVAALTLEAPLALAAVIGLGIGAIWNNPPAEFTNSVNSVDNAASNAFNTLKSAGSTSATIMEGALVVGGLFLLVSAMKEAKK